MPIHGICRRLTELILPPLRRGNEGIITEDVPMGPLELIDPETINERNRRMDFLQMQLNKPEVVAQYDGRHVIVEEDPDASQQYRLVGFKTRTEGTEYIEESSQRDRIPCPFYVRKPGQAWLPGVI